MKNCKKLESNELSLQFSGEGSEAEHPHNWPLITTSHLPPHLAHCLGHQKSTRLFKHTGTGIDAGASKGESWSGYFASKLV